MREDGEFDHVIVGAGSAGCVLASRLTEDPDRRVLLLEAGPKATNPHLARPGSAVRLWDTELDWAFRSQPQPRLDGRRIQMPRGRVLGGTSQLNFCVYIRGSRGDYDHWAQLGNSGWSYEYLLPHFRRAEDNARLDDAYHARGGPLRVEDFADLTPMHEMYLEALEDLGLPRNPDFNGATQEGCGVYQGTLRGGRRGSTADGHLARALGRPNLSVETGALATGLVVERGRCLGVDYVVGREARRARAESETILAAGAIGSPHLLLLSGVGPADEIAAHGIRPVHDLPGVGRNLLDHTGQPRMVIVAKDPAAHGVEPTTPEAAADRFDADGAGPCAAVLDVGGFRRMRATDADPSGQFFAGVTSRDSLRGALPPGLALTGYACRPRSRGSVTLATASPFDRPRIDPNYFAEPEDLERHVEIVEFNREIANHRSFERVRERLLEPFATREDILVAVRASASTTWHQSSTCRMGVDDEAVVTPELRVRGIDALRVCDASVMPTMVSGNLNAPVIMIAEKGSDLVRGGDRRVAGADARKDPCDSSEKKTIAKRRQ